MTTLIFVDKAAAARIVLSHLPPDIDPSDTYVVHMLLTGPARMKFVRGKALSLYPWIAPPQFVLDRDDRYDAHPASAYTGRLQGAPSSVPVTHLAHVDRIICAVDPDHSGIWAFRSALALWFGDELAQEPHEAWLLTALDERSVKAAIGAGTTTDALARQYDYGRTKRYFDYQWANNAHAVLPSVGMSAPSKFGLQLLYFLRANGRASESILMEGMCQWRGTGKYAIGEMGSPASRSALIAGLQVLGLVSNTSNGIGLSTQGEAFLARLHPDCQDLDLPQRLAKWCANGLEASQPGIDRYIRTVFGKQLRFASSPRAHYSSR